jgi:hypothetical protein
MFYFLNTSAQKDSEFKSSLEQKIWLYTSEGNVIKGFLDDISDSSVTIFTGKLSELNSHSKVLVISESYSNINTIKTKRRGGLIKGILKGVVAGLLPAVGVAAFQEGESGAYVGVATLPLGIITGAIVGSTSKRKFPVNGDMSRFHSFRRRIKL